MKHLIIVTSALALLAGTISSASAHDHGFRRGRTVIIQQQPQVQAFGLGALLLSQMLAQPQCCQQVAEPLVFPDDPPVKKFRRPAPEPKLRPESPIPMK